MLQETQKIAHPPTKVNFVLKGGGIGDYCAWMASILFIFKNFSHVKGVLYTEPYFQEIAKNIIPDWPVHSFSTLDPQEAETIPTFIPISASPQLAYICPINPIGAHLLEMGFIYYCQRNGPPNPTDGFYPQLNLKNVSNPVSAYKHRRLAVMTPGATRILRQMPSHVFNRIKDYLLAEGFLPIFLGKKDQSRNVNAAVDSNYDFSMGVDLLNQTTLLEAAKIISMSKLIVGLDNGLLHLAAMTETPIVYGHNLIEPNLRTPHRAKGRIVNVVPPPTLLCRFCQSKERFLFSESHNDRNCYVTLKEEKPYCVETMTAEDYIEAIEEAMA